MIGLAFLDGNSKIGLRQATCSPGPILWPSTISFELHAEMAEEIDPVMGNCRKFECSVTLTLDQVKVMSTDSTCRTTCMLNHVTVVSHITEIWPFEFRQILILDKV